MPYIDKEERYGDFRYLPEMEAHIECLDDAIYAIQCHIRRLPEDKKEGVANYCISRIVAGGLKPETGWRYMWLNRAYGTFLSAASEFYRRVVSKYEDDCIKKNGDIPEYEND